MLNPQKNATEHCNRLCTFQDSVWERLNSVAVQSGQLFVTSLKSRQHQYLTDSFKKSVRAHKAECSFGGKMAIVGNDPTKMAWPRLDLELRTERFNSERSNKRAVELRILRWILNYHALYFSDVVLVFIFFIISFGFGSDTFKAKESKTKSQIRRNSALSAFLF